MSYAVVYICYFLVPHRINLLFEIAVFQRSLFHLHDIFTCVALAKAGLVVGPLRPSGRPSVRPSVCPSVRPFVRPSVRPSETL